LPLSQARLQIESGQIEDAARMLASVWGVDQPLLRQWLPPMIEGLPADKRSAFASHVLQNADRFPGFAAWAQEVFAADHPEEERPAGESQGSPSNQGPAGGPARKAAMCFYSQQYEAATQTARQLVRSHTAVEVGLYWAIRANQRLAVAALDQAGDLDPNSPGMNVLLGDVYRKLRRYSDAEKYYRRALAANRNDPAAQVGLCTTQFMQGKLDEALATGSAALVRSPKDPELNLLLAEVLVKQRNYTGVMAYLQQALNVNSELLPRVHALRGQVMAAQGREEEATRELELASSTDNDGSIHYQLALLYRKQGEAEKASATMKESQQLYLDHRSRVAKGLSDVAISPAVQAEVQ